MVEVCSLARGLLVMIVYVNVYVCVFLLFNLVAWMFADVCMIIFFLLIIADLLINNNHQQRLRAGLHPPAKQP